MKSSYETLVETLRDLMRESEENGGKPATARIGGELYTAACPRPMDSDLEVAYWDEILQYIEEGWYDDHHDEDDR